MLHCSPVGLLTVVRRAAISRRSRCCDRAGSCLSPKEVEDPGLQEIRPYLQDSLWTTVGPDGAELLLTLAESGVLSRCSPAAPSWQQ